jgi:hypothetical protein
MESTYQLLTDQQGAAVAAIARMADYMDEHAREFGRELWTHSSLERLILTHGRHHKMHPMAKGYKRMTMRECYRNAATTAIGTMGRNVPPLYYCEGYAVMDGIGFAQGHAWVVDAEGRAYDPTWNGTKHWRECTYIGVVFNTKFVIKHMGVTGAYGMFSDDFPETRRAVAGWLRNGLPEEAWQHPTLLATKPLQA